jgi:hypothetical protein
MTTSPEPRAERRCPRRAALLATAAVLAGLAAVVGSHVTGGDQAGPDGVAGPPAMPPAAPAGGAGPRCMAELADAVAAASPEPVRTGRYAFVHSRWWGEDTSYSEKTGSTQTMSTYESQRWRADDGSGREYQIAIPDAPSRPDQTFHHTAGGMPGVVAEPIATSPDVLAAQLGVYGGQPGAGPDGMLRVVADVYKYHAVPRDARVALLRVLAADVRGLRCAGSVTDRAGRAGIAVDVVSDVARHRLIFDPFTGRLLAAEELLIRNPPALQGQVPRVRSYWLFLTNDRVDTLPR